MVENGMTCGFACNIFENADIKPFKSTTFCDNLHNGFVYDTYFFRSDTERDALMKFCDKSCSEISSEICGLDEMSENNKTDNASFEWSPLLFKSIYRDCCDGYGQTYKCSFCPIGTTLEDTDKIVTNVGTGFNATCGEFETWFDLEDWSHRMGETLDSYGPPSGNPTISCMELTYKDPIWSPIRSWNPTEMDCPCIKPEPSFFPTGSILPTTIPSGQPTVTADPSNSHKPSHSPTISPTKDPFFVSDTNADCSAKPSQTFSSIGGVYTGLQVAGIYAFLLFYKKFRLCEVTNEVLGQFVATVVAVGGIFVCLENSDSMDTVMSMTSILSVDGFELILTLITIPFIDNNNEESFDKARWDQLNGCTMWIVRFLIWVIGSGLPLVITIFTMMGEEDLPISVMIPCFVSLGIGMLFGFFGPCLLRNPELTGGGIRLIWVLVKFFVGVIPGLILAIYKKDWLALGWGAELFIELSHFSAEYI